MKDSFDISLLSSGAWVKKGCAMLIANIGKAIAVITLAVACLVFFTEIGFSDITSESFTSTLAMLLISSYIIYFSLEDSGERLGRETDEYKASKESLSAVRSQITGGDISPLREYCLEYERGELEYRKNSLLLSHGYTHEDLENYRRGRTVSKGARRELARIDRMRPNVLSVRELLSADRLRGRAELKNPEGGKLLGMILRLIPSTVCMILTVSVMISVKDGMTFSDVAEGLLKLSALPIIGLKGYTAGYEYATVAEKEWLDGKASLLGAYISHRAQRDGPTQQPV